MTQTSTKKAAPQTRSQEVWTRNEVIFMGRLGRDAEMNYTNGGKALTKFSLAIDQGKNKDAMWLNIVCWEQVAEEAAQASKGALVEVKGRLTQRKWNDKYYYDVVAHSVEVIKTPDSKKTEEEDDDLGDPSDHPF